MFRKWLLPTIGFCLMGGFAVALLGAFCVVPIGANPRVFDRLEPASPKGYVEFALTRVGPWKRGPFAEQQLALLDEREVLHTFPCDTKVRVAKSPGPQAFRFQVGGRMGFRKDISVEVKQQMLVPVNITLMSEKDPSGRASGSVRFYSVPIEVGRPVPIQ